MLLSRRGSRVGYKPGVGPMKYSIQNSFGDLSFDCTAQAHGFARVNVVAHPQRLSCAIYKVCPYQSAPYILRLFDITS